MPPTRRRGRRRRRRPAAPGASTSAAGAGRCIRAAPAPPGGGSRRCGRARRRCPGSARCGPGPCGGRASSRSRIWAGDRSLSKITTSASFRWTRSAISSALPVPTYKAALIPRRRATISSTTTAPAVRARLRNSPTGSIGSAGSARQQHAHQQRPLGLNGQFTSFTFLHVAARPPPSTHYTKNPTRQATRTCGVERSKCTEPTRNGCARVTAGFPNVAGQLAAPPTVQMHKRHAAPRTCTLTGLLLLSSGWFPDHRRFGWPSSGLHIRLDWHCPDYRGLPFGVGGPIFFLFTCTHLVFHFAGVVLVC